MTPLCLFRPQKQRLSRVSQQQFLRPSQRTWQPASPNLSIGISEESPLHTH